MGQGATKRGINVTLVLAFRAGKDACFPVISSFQFPSVRQIQRMSRDRLPLLETAPNTHTFIQMNLQ